jgi:hypothetical protein
MKRRIALTDVARELRERKLTREPLSYKKVYSAALDQRIPARRGDNGRWEVTEADLPLIAEILCGSALAA